MKTLTISLLFLALGCGCVATKTETAKTKPTFYRSWVAGHFEEVPAPALVRTNGSPFGKHGALITALPKGTPLDKAGLREGDLVLAINGSHVRSERQVCAAIETNGARPARFTVYRNLQIIDAEVVPGEERFRKINSIGLRLGLASHFEFDLWPDPDFSLVALGWEHKQNRVELQDAKSKYLSGIAAEQAPGGPVPPPLDSEEGWVFWIGPFFAAQHKVILSQE